MLSIRNCLAFIAVMSLLFYSCEPEYEETLKTQTAGHRLKGATIHYDDLISTNAQLQTITQPMVADFQNKSVGTSGDIQIDTTHIQVLESDFYKSYSFQIVQDSVERTQVLKNYVLTIFNDTLVEQMLVDYPVVNNEYDIASARVSPYDGDALYQVKSQPGFAEIQEWVQTCVDFECKGDTGGGHHGPGDTRCTASGNDRAYIKCTGAWVTRVSGGGGNTGTIGDDGDTEPSGQSGGGSGSTNNPDDNKNEHDVIGITPNDGNLIVLTPPDIECKKIAANLKSTDSSATTARYKAKLKQMADSVDIYTAEVSYSMFENDSGFDRYVGTPGGADNASLLVEPASLYTAFGHVHNDDATGTLSVFSIDDLLAFAEGISNNAINTSKFTVFLSTHHGTDGQHFALTISNVPKFRAFFNTRFPYTAPSTYDDQQILAHNTLIKNGDKNYIFTTLKYWEGTNPLISHIATDVEDQLKKFMQFLNEADMGVELFKTDKNFDTFKKLSYDSNTNQVKEKSC